MSTFPLFVFSNTKSANFSTVIESSRFSFFIWSSTSLFSQSKLTSAELSVLLMVGISTTTGIFLGASTLVSAFFTFSPTTSFAGFTVSFLPLQTASNSAFNFFNSCIFSRASCESIFTSFSR